MEPRILRSLPILLSVLVALTNTACGARSSAPSRPSVVLIIIDTLRADAVSSYGAVAGTTPEIDALSREGLRYERAYASAPWTLPSHATILSGLGVEQHRVGMGERGVLPDDVVTLAERLQAAGYDTAAFSENAIVSRLFGLVQGFARSRASRVGQASGKFVDINGALAAKEWLQQRDKTRPFFLFVNLADPHHPYEIRAENPFVAKGTPEALIEARPARPNRLICSGVPDPSMLAILRGLYLGEVHAADDKVAQIVRDVRAAAGATPPIIVIASDHGEYLGEEQLMGHEFGLHEVVLRVPLIVLGLPGVAPAVIPDTVGLIDITPSILSWAGIEVPVELPGKPLPQKSGGGPGDRAIYSFYSDATHWQPDAWVEQGLETYNPNDTRQFCTESDPVWGGMAAITQYPYKFVWYARGKSKLFDLSWDLAQKSDQSARQPQSIERFAHTIEPLVRETGLEGDGKRAPEISKEARDALEALGYAH